MTRYKYFPSQMTLWAMARSPIMFGGDVRRLDETTSNLITNPFILEINSFSTNNMEACETMSLRGLWNINWVFFWCIIALHMQFPFVTGTKVSAHKTTNHSRRLRRSLKEVGTSHTQFLGFTSCNHPKVNGWSIKALDQDLDQICWKESMRSHEPLCLYKRILTSYAFHLPYSSCSKQGVIIIIFTIWFCEWQCSDGRLISNQGGFHLLASHEMEFCLDASPRKKRTSKEFNSGSFSPCRSDANQVSLHSQFPSI